jgi:hypothetical protein
MTIFELNRNCGQMVPIIILCLRNIERAGEMKLDPRWKNKTNKQSYYRICINKFSNQKNGKKFKCKCTRAVNEIALSSRRPSARRSRHLALSPAIIVESALTTMQQRLLNQVEHTGRGMFINLHT